jgi:hypothetical protein
LAAATTRARVSAATLPRSFSTRFTVAVLTFAAAAISMKRALRLRRGGGVVGDTGAQK